MKFIDEYRNADLAQRYVDAIAGVVTKPWTVMEVCGGQTHAIVKSGIDRMLPPDIALLHGPGCPVCVTPVEMIDKGVAIALDPNVIFTSFGDMARVPGSESSLLTAKARGADLRLVYSPLDALEIARANPEREVVFFAVGFETTAPTTALTLRRARAEGIGNFSMLVAHVLVPPAMASILESPDRGVDGFLAAGHVCTVMGINEYLPIARDFRVPIVVTGFEPIDILQGLYMCLEQLESGRTEVENQYARAVRREGNSAAQAVIREVFEPAERRWRGIGTIAGSGLTLTAPYAAFDAERRFGPVAEAAGEREGCVSGQVLQGIVKPPDCPNFGTRCTPEHPLGAPMVSGEGACAAYFAHRGQGVGVRS